MIERAKQTWRRFKQSKPGHRYQDHYHHCKKGSRGRSLFRVILTVVGGLLVVGGGLIAVPGPGPGWLIILLGLGMVAGELLFFARWLDRAEVKLRKWTRPVVGIWRISPAIVKILIVLAILSCAIAMGIAFII